MSRKKCSKSLFALLLIQFLFLSACTVGGGASGSSSGAGDGGGGSASNTSFAGGLAGTIVADSPANNGVVANALISVESHPEITGTTDSRGHYAISNVPPGDYNVFITSAVLGGLSEANDASHAVKIKSAAAFGVKIENIVVTSATTTQVADQTMKKTGSITGIINFFQNPNNLDLTGSDVYVPGTSFSAKTSVTGGFTLSGIPEGTYDLRIDHLGFQSFILPNVSVVSNQTTNIGTKSLDLSKGPQGGVALDTTSANYVSAQSSGATYSIIKSRTVPLVFNFNADAVWMKVSDEPTFLNKSIEVVAGTKNWVFTSDGYKKIYVQFYDLNALPSSLYSVEFFVDTQAPTLSSVTLLNGWAQTATTTIFINSSATDSGSGIKEIMLSNISNAFSNGEVWVPYTNPINWTLLTGSGSGIRTVYAKVRDFVGNVSNVASSSINLGTQTIVYTQKIYIDKMTFYKEQSPYLISGPVEFDGDVEFKPGATVYIDNVNTMGFMVIKGVVTAIGTVANPITISDISSTSCDPTMQPTGYLLDMSQGAPFVSQNSVFQYVNFYSTKSIVFNGGTVSGNHFYGSCSVVTDYGGYNLKKGLDVLTMTGNVFSKWGTLIDVEQGNGNTIVTNNTGTIYNFYTQGATGTNTNLSNNSLTAVPGVIYNLRNNLPYTPSGNTFGSCGEVYHTDSPQNISIAAANTPSSCAIGVVTTGSGVLNVSGLNLSTCTTAIELKNNTGGQVNVSNSNFLNCEVGVNQYRSPGFISIFNSTINITSSTFKVSDQFIITDTNHGTSFTTTTTGSSITCANPVHSNYCDFLYSVLNPADLFPAQNYSLTFTGNTFNCVGDISTGCRGFVFIGNAPTPQTIGLTLSLDSNAWKNAPSKRPNSTTVNITAGATTGPGIPPAMTDSEVKIFQFGLHGSVNGDVIFSPSTISNTNQTTY